MCCWINNTKRDGQEQKFWPVMNSRQEKKGLPLKQSETWKQKGIQRAKARAPRLRHVVSLYQLLASLHRLPVSLFSLSASGYKESPLLRTRKYSVYHKTAQKKESRRAKTKDYIIERPSLSFLCSACRLMPVLATYLWSPSHFTCSYWL